MYGYHSRVLPRREFSAVKQFSTTTDEVTEDVIDIDAVPYDQKDREELKKEILLACAGTNRGFISKSEEMSRVKELVEMMEVGAKEHGYHVKLVRKAENPNKKPLEDNIDQIAGNWKLLYTDAPDVVLLGLIPVR